MNSKFDFIEVIKQGVRQAPDVILARPLQVSWQITLQCNLSCAYCYAGSGPHHPQASLPLDQLLDIADQIGCSGALDVTVEGGEPFRCAHILPVLQRLRRYPLALDILTNGTLVTAGVARTLRRILDPRLDTFQVSIDGPTPEWNDRQRGAGSLAPTLRGIAALLAEGFHVRTNTVVTAWNLAALPDLYVLLQRMGVRGGFALAPLFPVGRGRSLPAPEREAATEMHRRLLEMARRAGDLPVSGLPVPPPPRPSPAESVLRQRVRLCTGARAKLAIDPAGFVTPCVFFAPESFAMGNVLAEPLLDIWRGQAMTAHRQWLADLADLAGGGCAGCALAESCQGQCLGMSLGRCPGVATAVTAVGTALAPAAAPPRTAAAGREAPA